MKKTAVLIYNQFCNFEISVALEILALSEKPITVFAKNLSAVKSEDGLTVYPDKTIDNLNMEDYDSLLLPGVSDIRETISDEDILSFIRCFHDNHKIIGAISIAPILLVKSGIMGNRPFMAGINKEELFEEGFTQVELKNMQGWDDNLDNPIEAGYIAIDNIITSVSYEFVRFGLAFAKMLGIEMSPRNFGIRS